MCMKSQIYDDLAVEQIAKEQFGLRVDIDHVVVRSVPVSHTSTATVFLTTKKQLFAYITGQSRLTLGDIRKIVTRMGLVAELYLPPKGQPTYFDDIARDKFKAVYPGRFHPSADDLRYYRTLAPYNPALVQIQEIRNGEVYQFDTDSRHDWRLAAKFAYRRIKTI